VKLIATFTKPICKQTMHLSTTFATCPLGVSTTNNDSSTGSRLNQPRRTTSTSTAYSCRFMWPCTSNECNICNTKTSEYSYKIDFR